MSSWKMLFVLKARSQAVTSLILRSILSSSTATSKAIFPGGQRCSLKDSKNQYLFRYSFALNSRDALRSTFLLAKPALQLLFLLVTLAFSLFFVCAFTPVVPNYSKLPTIWVWRQSTWSVQLVKDLYRWREVVSSRVVPLRQQIQNTFVNTTVVIQVTISVSMEHHLLQELKQINYSLSISITLQDLIRVTFSFPTTSLVPQHRLIYFHFLKNL